MCGRYTLTSPHDAVAGHFETGTAPQLAARYNLAPSQESLIVTSSPKDGRQAVQAHWGWSLSQGGKSRLVINARSESVDQRLTFRENFASKRCLVPANGFFEWVGIGRGRQPYYFTSRRSALMGLAGLWSEDDSGRPTYVILTTDANSVVDRVHGRMPVILDTELYSPWLDPGPISEALAGTMFRPWPAADMLSEPVGIRVNDASCDEPECISPVPGPVDLFTN